MRELTDYERGFLRAIEKKGGELVMVGKYAHRTLDYLVEAGYLHRRSASLDTVVYALTEKGSAALAE
jgi:DNA-binding PadR family transcriptional regulator